MKVETVTDEQLRAYIAKWDAALVAGNAPHVKFQTANNYPTSYRGRELSYQVILPESVIELTDPQASLVNDWFHARQGMPYRLRPAPAVPAKHDGKLDEDERYRVYHSQGRYQDTNLVMIEGKYSSYGDDCVELQPAQALSLLAWLKQEEAELQRLAKEQAG